MAERLGTQELGTNAQPQVSVYEASHESSLNAGAELEREEANAGPSHEELFGEYTPGEVPELKKQVVLIQALEAQLQDLQYLRDDLLRTGGMSQRFALEAQRLLPDFDGGAPVGYYSQEPSATRYKIALEEIHRGIWAAVAVLVGLIIAAIAKLVHWLLTRGSSSSSTDPKEAATAKVQEAKENLKTLEENGKRIDELRQVLNSGEVTTTNAQGEELKRVTMSSLIEDTWTNQARYEHVLKFLKLEDRVLHDIATFGPYTKTFAQITPALAGISDALRQKAQQLTAVSKLDRHSFHETDRVINHRMLEILTQPLQLHVAGQLMTLEEAADHLARIRQQLPPNHSSSEPLAVDHLVKVVITNYRDSNIVKFFEEQRDIADTFTELQITLKRLETVAGDLSKDGAVGAHSEGVAAQVRAAVHAVGKDVIAYQKLFAELSSYGAALEHLALQVMGIAKEVETQLFAAARRGHVKLPDSWKHRGEKDRTDKFTSLFSAAAPRQPS